MASLYAEIENPLVRVLARMEDVGIAVDRAELDALNTRLTAETRRLGRAGPRGRGPGLQPQLAHPAPPDPVRGARPQLDEAHQDRAVHGRRHAREAARTSGPSSSSRCCSTGRSRSCAPPTARGCWPRWPPTAASTPRSTRPWPAPAASRRTSRTCTTSRSAPRRAASSAGPSSPPPAARCWWPTTTRSSCAASPTWPRIPGLDRRLHRRGGHPHRHRVAGVRRRAGRRHRPHAVDGQDGQLRPGLRHGGLRAGPAPQHPHRGRGGHPRRLLRRLPQREGVHGAHGQGGAHAGLHGDAVRPAPPDPRAVELQLPHPPGRRAPGHERGHPGPGRRHLQGGARPARPGARRTAATPAGSSSRCTTRCCWRCRRPRRTTWRRSPWTPCAARPSYGSRSRSTWRPVPPGPTPRAERPSSFRRPARTGRPWRPRRRPGSRPPRL